MSRHNRQKPRITIEGVQILEMVAEGKSLAKLGEKVLFVEGAVPGDVVKVRIDKDKKSYFEATLLEVEQPSALRTAPFCDHFGVCGGCKWQHLDYTTQLHFKEKQVKDALERIGKVDIGVMHPILAAPATQFYRNKLEFTFSNKKWLTQLDMEQQVQSMNALGFHIPKRYDKILNIEKCYLQADPSNAIRVGLRNFAETHRLSFYNVLAHEGLLRNLIIRTSNLGQTMVIVQFGADDKPAIELVMGYLKANFSLHSLFYVVNMKLNETFTDLPMHLYAGTPYIEEQMEHLTYRIGPKSFFQTNSAQALNLYKKTLEMASLNGNEIVYDLYTGTGTIANFIAHMASKVVGIEYVKEAIDDAKVNSTINGINNTLFFAGDMKDVLNADFIAMHGAPEVVITDPPRAGMHIDVVNTILALAPQRIVYVSCNPATQARDIEVLHQKYDVVAVQPVDMFPHTYHVENIALLQLRN
jgi:23S rRNA (uracil1939-C5)-methyltransferase